MKTFRWLLPLVICGLMTSIFAAEYSSRDEMNERDFEAVYDFIRCKRQIPLADKVNDLMISGDIFNVTEIEH